MRNLPPLGAAIAAVLLCASAGAQTSLEFPMTNAGVDPVTSFPMLRNDAAQVRQLLAYDAVRLTGFAMPDGTLVNFSLGRVDLAKRGFRTTARETDRLIIEAYQKL